MLVAASRLAVELMPSRDRLFWISRWPAPRKLRPMSLLSPPRTPGVVAARFQTLRPFSGSSTTARSLMVAETVGRSVSSTWALASTVTASVIAPTCSATFVRTTWLVATSTPVALYGRESGQADGDLVAAGLGELDVVVPLRVRGHLVVVRGAHVDGDDLRPGDDRSPAVRHRADQRRLRRELRPGTGGEKQKEPDTRRQLSPHP